MKKLILFIVPMFLILTGCASIRGKGGTTHTTLPGVTASVSQPENPKDATKQDVTGETEETYVVPAGSVIEQPQTVSTDSAGQTNVVAPVVKITLSEPMPVTRKAKHTAATTIGAAQVDVAGKILAVAKSVRWIQVVGLLFIVFGIASLAWPPLRLIINSVTTSAWCIGAGAFLLFVTPYIALHPAICFGISAGVVGLWYFAHRHGSVTAELATVKTWYRTLTSPTLNVPPPSPPTQPPTA
jgi:hypothetical protein